MMKDRPKDGISFVKMHGSGNDFILVDVRGRRDIRGRRETDERMSLLAREMCARHTGIGADGLIAVAEDNASEGRLEMLFKNPDGSDAGMCGNGARCFAVYATMLGWPNEFEFRMGSGLYRAVVRTGERSEKRAYEPLVEIYFPGEVRAEEVDVDGQHLYRVDAGTEHVVMFCPPEAFEQSDFMLKKGRELRYHPNFYPAGTNVNFVLPADSCDVHIVDGSISVVDTEDDAENDAEELDATNDAEDDEKREAGVVYLQTYERGVEGLTLACGTGAIASAAACHLLSEGAPAEWDQYRVVQKGGTVEVSFQFDKSVNVFRNICLRGPAVFVFEGLYQPKKSVE